MRSGYQTLPYHADGAAFVQQSHFEGMPGCVCFQSDQLLMEIRQAYREDKHGGLPGR